MDNIYMLSDAIILQKIGDKLRSVRLKQNITQQGLAEAANVSISTIKKMEKGDIGSFDSLLRIMRTLGKLDVLLPLVEEEQLSPSEYFNLVNSSKAKPRKRAAGKLANTRKEEPEW